MEIVLVFTFVFFGLAALGTFVHLRVRRTLKKRQFERMLEKPVNLSPEMLASLRKCFPFYAGLEGEPKKRFEVRLEEILQRKQVKVSGIQDPNGYVALVFSASLVQLTFGLADYTIPHFKRIIVMPDSFRSPLTGQYHKGEVHPTGAILLSWKHLAEGIADPFDGVAVGLHELAHALYIENFVPNSEDDFFSERQLAIWKDVAEDTLEEIRNHQQSFLRDYAGTNKHELFAVSVEYFFEQPNEFAKYHPDLYAALSSLLNLDPRRAGNPVMDKDVVMDIDED